jgi:hypothetical protein
MTATLLDVDARDKPGRDDVHQAHASLCPPCGFEIVIASEAKQSTLLHQESWIASSLRSSQ